MSKKIGINEFFDDGFAEGLKALSDAWRQHSNILEQTLAEIKNVANAMKKQSNASKKKAKVMDAEAKMARRLKNSQDELTMSLHKSNKEYRENLYEAKQLNAQKSAEAKMNKSAQGSYNRLSAELTLNKIKIKDLGDALGEGGDDFRKLAKDIETTEKKLQKMDKMMGVHKRNVGNYNSGLKGVIGTVKRFAATYLGFAAMNAAIRITKELTVQTNSLRLAYSKIIPDSNKLAKTNKFLSETADNYGINLNSLRKNYLRFTAASKSSNLTMEESQAIFSSVAKAGSVMGLEAIKIDRAFNALEQMLSKGKVSSEELRQQLGDSLPGSMEIMADALDVTTLELSKMLEEGKVLSDEALPKFAKQLEIAYGIENLNRVENLVAAQGRLKTSIINLVDSLRAGDFLASLYDTIAKGVDYVTKLLEGNTDEVSDNVRALQEQQIQLNVLVQTITDVNTTENQRLGLIKRLKAEYPNFLKNIDAEEVTNTNLRDRLKEVNAAYLEKIAIQKFEDKISEKSSKAIDERISRLGKQKELRRILNEQLGVDEANRIIEESGGSIIQAANDFFRSQTGRDVPTQKEDPGYFSQYSSTGVPKFLPEEEKLLQKIAILYNEIDYSKARSLKIDEELLILQGDLAEIVKGIKSDLGFFEPSGKTKTTDTTDTTDTTGSSKEEIHAERLAEIEYQRIWVESAKESFKKIAALRLLDLEKAELIRDQDIHNAKEGSSDKFDAEQEYLRQRLKINLQALNDINDLQDKYDKEKEERDKEELRLKKEQLSIELQIQDNKVRAQNLDKQQEELEILGNKILYLRKLKDLETDDTKKDLIQSQITAAESDFIAKSTQSVKGDTKEPKDAKIFGFSLRKVIKKLLPEEAREDEKKVDAAFEAVVSGFAIAKDAMTDYYRTAIQLSNELVQQRNQEVASAERALEREIASRNAGYANFVDDAQNRLDQAKKSQEEALRQRQAFQRQQLIADSISQASGLTLAAVNIFKQFPFPLGLAFVAPMFGAFVAAKAKAFELTRQNFAEGDLSIIGGGRHGSGNDTLVGFSGGRAQFAEQGEARMILSRRATARYADILPTLFNQLSNGTFNADSMIGRNSYIQPSAVIVNTDTTRVEKELVAIRRQGEIQTIYDNGKKVVIKGNRTKRYV